MSKINSTETDVELEDESSTKDGKRRTSYVSRDHKSMVEFVAEIYKNLGHSDHHNNKAIATVHRLSPASIKQQLTSCQQYRLLEIKFGTGYKITDLFTRIFLPVNDSEKRAAVIESLKSPDTYQHLFKEYEYHVVPPVNGIKNHFVRNFQMKDDIAEKAAEVFIENLKDYDLLDSRGVLTSAMPVKPSGGINTERQPDGRGGEIPKNDPPPPPPPPPSPRHDEGLFELPIPLPNKRRAYLRYPLDLLTKRDIKVIRKALDFIASSIDGAEDDEDETNKGT
jgi:hypothetical protein